MGTPRDGDGRFLWAVRLLLMAALGLGAGYVWGCNAATNYRLDRIELKLDKMREARPQ